MRLFVLGSFVQACCWTVSRLPRAGETYEASGVTVEAGGKGLNVAIGARRLGAEVDIALGVGRDHAARELADLLECEGVGAEHVYPLGQLSGYGAGLIGQDGQNAIAVYPGPNLLLNAEHMALAEPAIREAHLVYGQFETSIEAVGRAFAIARRNRILTVLNPSPWRPIPEDLLGNTDVLIVNEVEACSLLGLPALSLEAGAEPVMGELEAAARDFFDGWRGQCLAVTLGEWGSVAISPLGDLEYCQAPRVVALDTIGAGDAFASGFCLHYLKGGSVREALAHGNACGALVASRQGVLAALPDTDALRAFMGERGFKSPA
jgi:ribokinase